MNEIWKDIEGFKGLYQVSDLGRVRSLDRYSRSKNEKFKLNKGQLLKLMQKTGYLRVSLSSFPVYKKMAVHRLVATAFIPNPENKKCINHKDGNKLNNCIDNLEWCTVAENNLHAYRVVGKVNPMQGRRGKLNPNSKPVICLTTNERFDNVREAGEKCNVFSTSISKICKGKGHHVGGLKFKYA